MRVLSEVEELAITAALNKMSKSYFDICVLDGIIRMCELPRHGFDDKAYETLRLLHCMDFSAMDSRLRDQIQPLMAKVLGMDIPENVVEPIQRVVNETPRKRLGVFSLTLFN